jgi:hypothetical protein
VREPEESRLLEHAVDQAGDGVGGGGACGGREERERREEKTRGGVIERAAPREDGRAKHSKRAVHK